MRSIWPGGAICAVLALLSARSWADATPCTPPLDREAVVGCAVATSPEVRREERELDAVFARRIGAGRVLPSTPALEVSAAGRSVPGETALNAYITVGQEFEIGGQRGGRLAVVEVEVAAQRKRVAAVRREVTAHALGAHAAVVAAEERVALGRELGEVAESLRRLVEARVARELLAEVDARVALADAVRLRRTLAAAERERGVARAELAVLTGLAPEVVVHGGLEPLWLPALGPEALVERGLAVRGEIAAAEAERAVLARRLDLLRAQQVPNVTLSLFAQRDGFSENVLGGGIAIPIPLPGRTGHVQPGEAEELRARQEVAAATVEAVRQRVRREVLAALAEMHSRKAELDAFPIELVSKARDDLRNITVRLGEGQLPVRDALLTQRALVELLEEHLLARHAFVLASFELARAAGLDLGDRP